MIEIKVRDIIKTYLIDVRISEENLIDKYTNKIIEDIYKKAQQEKDAGFKKKVLEFQNVLKRAMEDNCNTITTEDTLDVFQDIFGDYEK